MAQGSMNNGGWSLGVGPLFYAPPSRSPILKHKSRFPLQVIPLARVVRAHGFLVGDPWSNPFHSSFARSMFLNVTQGAPPTIVFNQPYIY